MNGRCKNKWMGVAGWMDKWKKDERMDGWMEQKGWMLRDGLTD